MPGALSALGVREVAGNDAEGDVQETDEKRQKAIKKVVEKEEKARAPVLKRAGADKGQYLEGLQRSLDEARAQLARLQASEEQ